MKKTNKKTKTVGEMVSIEQQATINAVVEIIWAKAQKNQLLDGKSAEKHKHRKRELLALVYSEDIASMIAEKKWWIEINEDFNRELVARLADGKAAAKAQREAAKAETLKKLEVK